MMSNIRYLIAMLYTDIKSRRPSGTPYFKVRIGIAFGLWLHVLQILLLLKITTHKIPMPKGENAFIGSAFLTVLAGMGIITWLFPEGDLLKVKLNETAVKRVKFYYFGYFLLSILFLAYLMTLDSKNLNYLR
jgi:hypothetical protein